MTSWMMMITMSFWTQHLLEIDRTPTLDNYWHLIEPSAPGEEIAHWMGIAFPFKRAVYVVLMLKSILMSLQAISSWLCRREDRSGACT